MSDSVEEESCDEKPSRSRKISLLSIGRHNRAAVQITRKTVRPKSNAAIQTARKLQEERDLLTQNNYPIAIVEPRQIQLLDPPGEILPTASCTVIDVPEKATRNLVIWRIVPHEAKKAIPPSKAIARRILLNFWFWKISLVSVIFAAAALILSYSIFFSIVFAIFGREISFYPWSWGVMYTSTIGAIALVSIGFIVSAPSLVMSIFTLRRRFIPGFQKSYFS